MSVKSREINTWIVRGVIIFTLSTIIGCGEEPKIELEYSHTMGKSEDWLRNELIKNSIVTIEGNTVKIREVINLNNHIGDQDVDLTKDSTFVIPDEHGGMTCRITKPAPGQLLISYTITTVFPPTAHTDVGAVLIPARMVESAVPSIVQPE
jgi:hypothetical protein